MEEALAEETPMLEIGSQTVQGRSALVAELDLRLPADPRRLVAGPQVAGPRVAVVQEAA